MPANRNALIRYKTIDLCLQNNYRKWTLDDIIDAVSDALYEYEGMQKRVSRRTIQLDLQMMRSDKLGYNAPIIVEDKKHYTYEDPDYSITNIPLSENDLTKLTETVDFLKQFKGFSHFRELEIMVQKLEDHIYARKEDRNPVIDFEKNENLKGLEFLDLLYHAIIEQKQLNMTYQSFVARQESSFHFHPYLLKEFRNRWFLVGVKNYKEPLLTLALDRIVAAKITEKPFRADEDFSAESYFRDVIGVTVNPGSRPETVTLFVTHKHAPYVLTKPFHWSQRVIERDGYGVTIALEVQHNYELEKEILGMGDGIMVLGPERLKRSITERISNALDGYNSAVDERGLLAINKRLIHKGYTEVRFIYTTRSLRQLGWQINKMKDLYPAIKNNIVLETADNKSILGLLINKNTANITHHISKGCAPYRIHYFTEIPEKLCTWHQSNEGEVFSMIVFLEHAKIQTFPLQVVPGSHHKTMTRSEINVIVDHCLPTDITLTAGSATLLLPGIIKRFPESLKGKGVRFFWIYFH